MKRLAPFLFAIALAGCSRPSPAGVYETVGNTAADEARFKMVLTLEPGGEAKLTANANLGDAQRSQAVASVMSVPSGRWTLEKNVITLTGTRGGDGKPVTYHFAVHESGDLMWTENAPARFHKRK
jgi:hypothetical protein